MVIVLDDELKLLNNDDGGEFTMDLSSTGFDAYNAKLQASALAATRKSAGIPGDVGFHRSMDQDLASDLDAFSDRVLAMTNRLLNLVSTVDYIQGKGKAKLESEDDVVDQFHSLVVDSMDQLLERTDTCLDQFLGKNKAPAIAINPPIMPKQKVTVEKGRVPQAVIQHAAYLSKPQLHFTKKPDNSDTPWHPTLPHKYNAKVPLGHVYVDEADNQSDNTLLANHPYRYEITHLTYPTHMFQQCTPTPPKSLEDTQATWVGTLPDFHTMLAKLRNTTEIAVDLEHHSYRSYAGFLCLMQISTREEDFVVDLLVPEVRKEAEALNEVFTDSEIVKIFHGAESDIVWLQQDFNIYIVNLFDTFHASKLLEFPRHGLANLLEMYCDFVPDKRYQLADWRIRPLPEDMLKYARSDTHFLLYIYDNLRNALLDRSQSQSRAQSPSAGPSTLTPAPSTSSTPTASRGLLSEVLFRSADTSLRVYAKEMYDINDGTGSGGWDTLAKKWNKGALLAGGPGVGVGAMQREVYRAVHWWRERVAREEDESTRYVLANHTLFQLAEQPPADMAALLAIFRSSVPPMVKKRARELLTVVKDAVKRGMAAARVGGVTETKGQDADVNANTTASPCTDAVPTGAGGSKDQLGSTQSKKDVVMLDVEMKSLEDAEGLGNVPASTSASAPASVPTKATDIWGRGDSSEAGLSSSLRPSTSQSSLFGSTSASSRSAPTGQKAPTTRSASATTAFATSVSTLLGSRASPLLKTAAPATMSTSSASNGKTPATRPHFQDLVAKINRSFTLGSSAPQLPVPVLPTSTPEPPANVQAETARFDEATGMQVEIAYMPASQRPTKVKAAAELKEPDTIVVVGQARQKRKRKEPKATASGQESKSGTPGAEDEDAAEPFDFSAVSNILDDNPDTEDRKKKRQKKQPKTGQFFGDFPAPPKAYSELKSGNQSHTFK
ncbi:hypothetical protein D9619_007468 [Psilocybe cf. subviscida]|uniref:HRDC domain-containing protein n=1 Tax=Psilocybe cf. subviscida TaxID=2480587 RepID=A0A8H5B3K9_9AGAR|nr:hypothetical protein D9619_007468 [Psilocybe cf. subviscida]